MMEYDSLFPRPYKSRRRRKEPTNWCLYFVAAMLLVLILLMNVDFLARPPPTLSFLRSVHDEFVDGSNVAPTRKQVEAEPLTRSGSIGTRALRLSVHDVAGTNFVLVLPQSEQNGGLLTAATPNLTDFVRDAVTDDLRTISQQSKDAVDPLSRPEIVDSQNLPLTLQNVPDVETDSTLSESIQENDVALVKSPDLVATRTMKLSFEDISSLEDIAEQVVLSMSPETKGQEEAQSLPLVSPMESVSLTLSIPNENDAGAESGLPTMVQEHMDDVTQPTVVVSQVLDPVRRMAMHPITQQVPRTYSLFYCIGISALVAGMMAAKRLSQKTYLHEIWDRRLEDDLAYDIAYTTSSSEIGYGSVSWGGNLDKFDV